MAISAGLDCLTSLTRAAYGQARQPGEAEATFLQRTAKLAVPEGTCGEDSKASMDWEAGAHAGKVMCYVDADGAAVLEWTYGDVPVMGIAHRRDGDQMELWAWWRSIGRLLSR